MTANWSSPPSARQVTNPRVRLPSVQTLPRETRRLMQALV